MTHFTAANLTPDALRAHLHNFGWADVEIVTPERQAS